MSKARPALRGLVLLTLAVFGSSAASSCYRAEIDLKVLTDDAAGGTQAAAGSGGGADGESGGEAGQPGAGGEAPSCWSDELDPEQAECQKLGHLTREECGDFKGGDWDGCYFGGCFVCTKVLRPYPYYFQWHPCCQRNSTCYSNKPVKCDPRCPRPTERDKHPRCAATSAAANVRLGF